GRALPLPRRCAVNLRAGIMRDEIADAALDMSAFAAKPEILPLDQSITGFDQSGYIINESQELDLVEYIFLMHDDADDEGSWELYLQTLRENGSFEGGSAIGNGVCVRKRGAAPSVTAHLTGYIRVKADNIEHAKALLAGNPHFEGGGTVEIR